MKIITAARLRKGQLISIDGVVVRLTRREKWNSIGAKLSFEDCGNGLPDAQTVMFCGLAAEFSVYSEAVKIDLPPHLCSAIENYLKTDWNKQTDPTHFGALNAVAYIGERVIALYTQTKKEPGKR